MAASVSHSWTSLRSSEIIDESLVSPSSMLLPTMAEKKQKEKETNNSCVLRACLL